MERKYKEELIICCTVAMTHLTNAMRHPAMLGIWLLKPGSVVEGCGWVMGCSSFHTRLPTAIVR